MTRRTDDPERDPPGDLATNAAIAVDLVVLTIRDGRLHVLLVRRGIAPHRGRWALPGGFVLPSEELSDAAARELREETGVSDLDAHLEQLATYGSPRRDPRGRVVSVAFLALVADLPEPVGATDAADARWVETESVPSLAFDHDKILADGLERARSKLEYTTLATALVAKPFTLTALRAVYEAVWGGAVDSANFRRKVLATEGFVRRVSSPTRSGERGRPAVLYRPGPAIELHPPILRQRQDR